ncbi:MAG: hypothetical protein AB7J30_15510 [Hyphomicrobium sp.]|uniref:hypothetical protein n=1 Tax=Hyphomicrobium sp. TaxID=82 RepID=UPI003D13A9CA
MSRPRPPLWAVPEDAAARLALATAYPFAIPEDSYLFEDGAVLPLPADWRAEGRTPVLAVGSNQSPDQLARKFAQLGGRVQVPVTRCWLEDFDVVYATHITRYGAIPGNLHPAPGCRVRLSVTWFDAAQLAVVHETELTGENYVYGRLDGAKATLADGRRLETLQAYVSLNGVLNEGGRPIGLAALMAENRPHPALSQPEALALLHGRHGRGSSLEAMILASIGEPEERRRLTAILRRDALRCDWEGLTILER